MTKREYTELSTMLAGGVWSRSVIQACAHMVCDREVPFEEVMAAQQKFNPPPPVEEMYGAVEHFDTNFWTAKP